MVKGFPKNLLLVASFNLYHSAGISRTKKNFINSDTNTQHTKYCKFIYYMSVYNPDSKMVVHFISLFCTQFKESLLVNEFRGYMFRHTLLLVVQTSPLWFYNHLSLLYVFDRTTTRGYYSTHFSFDHHIESSRTLLLYLHVLVLYCVYVY